MGSTMPDAEGPAPGERERGAAARRGGSAGVSWYQVCILLVSFGHSPGSHFLGLTIYQGSGFLWLLQQMVLGLSDWDLGHTERAHKAEQINNGRVHSHRKSVQNLQDYIFLAR